MIKYPETLKVDEESFIQLRELMEQDQLDIKGNFYFCVFYKDFVKLKNYFESQIECNTPIRYYRGKYTFLGYKIIIASSKHYNEDNVLDIIEDTGNRYKSFKLQYQTKEN